MSFYFYDLETSGLDPRWSRIMQFAGQRVDDNLEPIGKPDNILIKMTDEILPEPDAIMVTGITPQKTQEGITELEFLKFVNEKVFTAKTIVCGFNSIRFDDEFMRYSLYRNYFDPYEREWKDGRTRWDIVDLMRMTRALRPDGITWPVSSSGKQSNRLTALTEANNIEHGDAHDALADVTATIEVAKLVKKAQPKLFDHYLGLRKKAEVAKLLNLDKAVPLVHSTGKFSGEYVNTSVVMPLIAHPSNPNAILVFDLRYDPAQFAELSEEQLSDIIFKNWRELEAEGKQRLPVKAIHVNKSPAIAPLSVLNTESQERINLSRAKIDVHLKSLMSLKGFARKVSNAYDNGDFPEFEDADGRLYEGFITDSDKAIMQRMHRAGVYDNSPDFADARLDELWLRFKGRNFPKKLSADEKTEWETFRSKRLSSGGGMTFQKYMNRLKKLAEENKGNKERQYLLEELQLWAESIAPFENETLL